MIITETTAGIYGSTFQKLPNVYCTVEFTELNRHKVDAIHYLIVSDTKPRFGIIMGEKDGELRSPFSAPFGGFVTNGAQRTAYINEAVTLLRQYCHDRGMTARISMPPLCYADAQAAEFINAFSQCGKVYYVDLNYHFDVADFAHYADVIGRNARKNLNQARKETFEFTHICATDTQGVERAYSVIQHNRREHGYPLKMSLDDVKQTTTQVVSADFFILSHNGTDVAAAQVYIVTDKVAQVIYWGDKKEFSHLRSMNMMAYKLFEYYYNNGVAEIIDIGPSSAEGVPNDGLCDFKTSIGCKTTPKLTFTL